MTTNAKPERDDNSAPPDALLKLVDETPEGAPDVSLDDFWSVLPLRMYWCSKTNEFWPGPAVNGRFKDLKLPDDVKPAAHLDATRAVEQITWAPGEPTIIENRVLLDGEWVSQPGYKCLNTYRPPPALEGDPEKARRWLDHWALLYPDAKDHIIKFFAHAVQHPEVKINHALDLIGPPGIGKDTGVEGVKQAVGRANCKDIGPAQVMGRFNPHVKNVLLTISEVRDLGENDRYNFYEKTKTLLATPPNTLPVDEKNVREYSVLNRVAVIITSNHLMNGIYLPPDDRRHYVANSDITRDYFGPDEGAQYFKDFFHWYEHEGGYGHVAAYLRSVDLTDWNPKAPPPKTAAFWAVVAANKGPEDAELAALIEGLANPHALTLRDLASEADEVFRAELLDRRNTSRISHRLADAGYVAAMNPARKTDGFWKVAGKPQRVYARQDLSIHDRVAAAQRLAGAR